MKIRELTAQDQSQINEIQAAFMVEFFPGFADDPQQYEWNADIYDIRTHYLQQGGMVWVAEVDNIIAGFGGYHLLDSNTAEIKRVRVDAPHRGKGLGKAIILQIEDHCRAANLSKIQVDTDDRFGAAKCLYTKLGYVLYYSESKTTDNITCTDNFYNKDL